MPPPVSLEEEGGGTLGHPRRRRRWGKERRDFWGPASPQPPARNPSSTPGSSRPEEAAVSLGASEPRASGGGHGSRLRLRLRSPVLYHFFSAGVAGGNLLWAACSLQGL